MMAGIEAHNGAETGGTSPPPSSSSSDPAPAPDAATVVITVGSLEAGGPKADPAGGGKVLVEQQQQELGKGAAFVAVDLGCGGRGADGRGDWDREKVCRICHLSPARGEEGPELIQLGCGCKEELGAAHRDCAEAWFKLKGNRCCEICGSNAKNITGEEDGSFMEVWHEGRALSEGGNTNSPQRGGCWRGQPFCNFLMACLVIAFILPWFFRVNMF